MSVQTEHDTLNRLTPDRQTRPGWPELLVGLVVMAVVAYGVGIALRVTGAAAAMGPVAFGVILAALSGVAGLIAFGAADRLRVRDWSAFGVRRTSRRWILIGLAAGLVALVVANLLSTLILSLFDLPTDTQQSYADAAGGGVVPAILSALFLGVLTPIGEEFLFRGVVATVLLRYGALIGVVGSALIFAAMHGPNIVFVTALVVGLIAAELRRRSGSVWPGVVAHLVNNVIVHGALVVLALTS
ncbi:CPBP family intramembrane glutamic endopeptidase [Cryptosporangium phraense]|uniref:CPBP family intramembrane metalloprotease n=1 Tax=Cryptosporangium phraense TaxID=2593070 RepID=A0A545AL24_9ACTN|nr:type II CAAX endopeptidase family protein [Cryptosporangium phraense]TQS41435.1 CPBP family intramembrane metalloprotease [Cryptosporangium phraense]